MMPAPMTDRHAPGDYGTAAMRHVHRNRFETGALVTDPPVTGHTRRAPWIVRAIARRFPRAAGRPS
jgi:hypothetical protein